MTLCDSFFSGPFKTSVRKKTPVIHSKSMTLQLCKAVQKCLGVSPSLKTLHLHGLPLRARDLDTLTKVKRKREREVLKHNDFLVFMFRLFPFPLVQGLSKSLSLEHLSLAHCPIADDGLESESQVYKYFLFETKYYLLLIFFFNWFSYLSECEVFSKY